MGIKCPKCGHDAGTRIVIRKKYYLFGKKVKIKEIDCPICGIIKKEVVK